MAHLKNATSTTSATTMSRTGKTLCFFTLLLFLVWILPAWGAVYKWKDENGRVHFTDNITQVPPEQRPRQPSKKPKPRKKTEEPEVKNPWKTTRKPAMKKNLSRQQQEIRNKVETYRDQENARDNMMRGIYGVR